MRIDGFLSGSRAAQFSRRLRFESLERRQMLTVTVDTLVDEADGSITDGDVSLRDAIANAPAGETIDFSVTGTINLTLGQLVIFKDLSIVGPGPGLLTVDAAGNDSTPGVVDGMGSRVFLINDGDSNNELSVLISGISMVNGDVSGDGGGILNREILNIANAEVSNNHAFGFDGGGIFSNEGLQGSLSIHATTFSGNTASDDGGAIRVRRGFDNNTLMSVSNSLFLNNSSGDDGGALFQVRGRASFVDSVISGNTSADRGGGIYSYRTDITLTSTSVTGNTSGLGGGVFVRQASLSVFSSTLHTNRAMAGDGGAIWMGVGNITIRESTISGNESTGRGGGISSRYFGNLDVSNSTLSGNTAGDKGGAIYTDNKVFPTLTSTTVTGNHADSKGGGVYLGPYSMSASGEVKNSIIANNTVTGPTASDISGTVNAEYSLIKSTNGTTILGFGNILGVDPMLGSLQDNGGPTETHALLPDSPAIDAGDPGFTPPPNFDQRGATFDRVSGGRIDMGAYEVQIAAPDSADFDLDGFITGADFLLWQIGFGTPAPDAVKTDGDADNDQDVDGDDLTVWENQYGTAAPVVVASSRLSPQLVDLAMMMDKPEATLDTNRTEVQLPEPYLEVVPDSVSAAPLPQRDTAQPATVSVASAEEERATEEDVAVLSELVFSDL